MGKVFKIAGGVAAALLVILIVAWFALRRGDIPYAKLEEKYADATSHYVNLPGGYHIRYRDQGNPKGPVLVLVHGFFVSSDTWRPWVQRLGSDYRIVTLDLPGHGLTRAPKGFHASLGNYVGLLDAFAQAEHLDHFVLAGSSMGGDVAWRYALAHPEKLNGLILVDSAGWPDPRPEAAENLKRVQIMRNPLMRFLLRDLDQGPRIRDGLLAAYADKRLVTPAMVAEYTDLGRAPGHRDAIIDLFLDYGHEGYATPEKLAPIKTPTLILEGEKDELVPPANASRFAAAIHGSRLILYPDVGHVVQEEAPDASAASVRAFLKSLQPKPKKPADAPKPATGATNSNPNTNIFY